MTAVHNMNLKDMKREKGRVGKHIKREERGEGVDKREGG